MRSAYLRACVSQRDTCSCSCLLAKIEQQGLRTKELAERDAVTAPDGKASSRRWRPFAKGDGSQESGSSAVADEFIPSGMIDVICICDSSATFFTTPLEQGPSRDLNAKYALREKSRPLLTRTMFTRG
jgi:hypothetical protein